MTYPHSRLTRPLRRAIMLTLIAAFFILCPLIILYTAGYRYNWHNHRIEQTGVISIDVEPTDARIWLNNILITQPLPLRLPNRAPGSYHLRIEDAGYLPWEKEISVDSQQTTYIKQITLFRDTLPVLVPGGKQPITKFIASPDGVYLLLVSAQPHTYEINLWDTETQKTTALTRGTNPLPRILDWSPAAHVILMSTQEGTVNHLQLFSADTPDLLATYDLPRNSAPLIYQWNQDATVPGLYFQDGSTLKLLTLEGARPIDTLPQAGLPWFVDANGSIWLLDTLQQKISLLNHSETFFSFTTAEPIKHIVDLNDGRLIGQTDHALAVVPRGRKDLVNSSMIPTHTMYNSFTREWLAWSASELWSIYPDGNTALLNRTSDLITGIRPLDPYGVVLLQTATSLTAFNPGYYVSQTLFHGGTIDATAVNQQTRHIYFLGTIGKNHGLYDLAY